MYPRCTPDFSKVAHRDIAHVQSYIQPTKPKSKVAALPTLAPAEIVTWVDAVFIRWVACCLPTLLAEDLGLLWIIVLRCHRVLDLRKPPPLLFAPETVTPELIGSRCNWHTIDCQWTSLLCVIAHNDSKHDVSVPAVCVSKFVRSSRDTRTEGRGEKNSRSRYDLIAR